MATKQQRTPKVEEKTKTNLNPTPVLPSDGLVSGPPIRVVYDGQTYNFLYGELGVDIDPAVAGDRTVIDALARKLEEVTGQKIVLRTHDITRLENGNWLVTPPATYGA